MLCVSSLLIYFGFNCTGGPSLSASMKECDTVLIAAHWQHWTRVTRCGCRLKTLNMRLTRSGIGFQWRGWSKGGLTKSYYAGQDVLIVLRPSDAEHTHWGKRRGFNVSSLENAKIEIHQPFNGTGRLPGHQSVSGLLVFQKIRFDTNEQHTVYQNIPTALRPQPQYDLWTVASTGI